MKAPTQPKMCKRVAAIHRRRCYIVRMAKKRDGGGPSPAAISRWENEGGALGTHLNRPRDPVRPRKLVGDRPGDTAARQIASFLSRFDPTVSKVMTSARAALRRRFPTAIEQVYDNYNFFVIGFCTTERTSDCFVSLAASARGVILSFYHGATLPDPHKVLLGSGKQNRFLRLENAARLSDPEVKALLASAAGQARTPLPATGMGYTMIKSVSAKQRPRRKAS